MKRNIILATVTLVILIGVLYFVSGYQLVTFSFNTPSGGVELVPKEGKPKVIKNNTTTLLKNGTYTILAVDSRYSKDGIEVDITNDSRDIPVDFTYSISYLRSLLTPKELEGIESAITSKYSQRLNGFTVNTGSLLGQGEWYITTITKNVQNEGEIPDTYRVVLKKEKEVWVVKTTPSLILSIPLNKSIPGEVIRAANSL